MPTISRLPPDPGGSGAAGPASCKIWAADVGFDLDHEFFTTVDERDEATCLRIVENGLVETNAWRLKRDGARRALKLTLTGVAMRNGRGDDLPGATPVDDGRWHHAAGVWDGRTASLWIDGEIDATSPATGAIRTNSSSLRIGSQGWAGAIDEVRIWNRALSPEEVRALARGALASPISPVAGETDTLVSAPLSWHPAESATGYDLYLGSDPDAVAGRHRRALPERRPSDSPGALSPRRCGRQWRGRHQRRDRDPQLALPRRRAPGLPRRGRRGRHRRHRSLRRHRDLRLPLPREPPASPSRPWRVRSGPRPERRPRLRGAIRLRALRGGTGHRRLPRAAFTAPGARAPASDRRARRAAGRPARGEPCRPERR